MSRPDLLKTDCSECAALCCVALTFDKGKDFAFSKNPGEPCRNLSGHKCSVHATLNSKGLSGCVAYDCLGAGNRVVQEVFEGHSWQDDPRLLRVMIEAFAGMREVHKRIDLMRAAATLPLDANEMQTCHAFLERLEQHRWTGPDLNEFEMDLALEIDIFFHGIRHLLPAELARQDWLS